MAALCKYTVLKLQDTDSNEGREEIHWAWPLSTNSYINNYEVQKTYVATDSMDILLDLAKVT